MLSAAPAPHTFSHIPDERPEDKNTPEGRKALRRLVFLSTSDRIRPCTSVPKGRTRTCWPRHVFPPPSDMEW